MRENIRKLGKTLKPYVSCVLELLVAIFMVIGVVDTANGSDFMSKGVILYFTIQSNITIAAVCFAFFVIQVVGFVKKKTVEIPKWLYVLKFLFTVAITLTMLVFWCMLMPTMAGEHPEYIYNLGNLMCHTFVPLLAIIDWLLFSRGYKGGKYDLFWGTAMPLYYLAFSMICSVSGVTFDPQGSKVPYFFLNYEELSWFQIGNGKFGVFYWILIIVVIVLGLSAALFYGQRAIEKKRTKKVDSFNGDKRLDGSDGSDVKTAADKDNMSDVTESVQNENLTDDKTDDVKA